MVVILVTDGVGLLASFRLVSQPLLMLAGSRWALWPLFTVKLETWLLNLKTLNLKTWKLYLVLENLELGNLELDVS